MKKYTLEEVIEALKTISIINPVHVELEESGYGEFPDSYLFTDSGDLSDLGNEIGIVIGNEKNINEFISGLKHGISLSNGTH